MSPEELDEFKYKGLTSRVLQSFKEKEHLEFPGSSKPDFILFLRFKFGLCEKEAVTVFDRLQADKAVNNVEELNHVVVNPKIFSKSGNGKIHSFHFSVYGSFDYIKRCVHIIQIYTIVNDCCKNDQFNYVLSQIDVDPDWLYPDPDPQNLINPDPDPDPGRIQVNKITKFSKHLLIGKSQKNFYTSSHSERTFF